VHVRLLRKRRPVRCVPSGPARRRLLVLAFRRCRLLVATPGLPQGARGPEASPPHRNPEADSLGINCSGGGAQAKRTRTPYSRRPRSSCTSVQRVPSGNKCFRAISAHVPVGSSSRYLRHEGRALSRRPSVSYVIAR
jgi:hypothetical protein